MDQTNSLIKERIGRKQTFLPSTKIPMGQWGHGRYAAFDKRVRHQGSSSKSWQTDGQPNMAVDANKYSYKNNYKGKNPMTRTQWRRFQRQKKQEFQNVPQENNSKGIKIQEKAKRPVIERLSQPNIPEENNEKRNEEECLDLIGEIKPASSKNQRFIIVGVDYFTKWIEAVPMQNVDQEAVISFIQKYIIYRFGIPETITTDQGSVFTGRKMQEFANQTGFRLLTSTPYYAQANGQVEAANKILIGLIKKHIAQKPRNWNNTLDQVLWACRNSPKESTNTTPFRLTYGHDAVLPVEIHLQSIRIQRQMEIPNDHYWNMMLDELVDLDEERIRALERLTQQKEKIAKVYNEKVKSKTFNIGDLVWKTILPMDRKDRILGKWSPNWEGPFKISQIYSNGAYEIEELTSERRILNINGKYLKKYKPTLCVINICHGSVSSNLFTVLFKNPCGLVRW